MRYFVWSTILWARAAHALVGAESDEKKIRGVNLGGWLVLEPWITPGLFASANDGVPRASDNSFQVMVLLFARQNASLSGRPPAPPPAEP